MKDGCCKYTIDDASYIRNKKLFGFVFMINRYC